jgi:prevent-host-death family protein
VSAREANQQFSRVLERAVAGEEVTITRRGVPVAKLVPVRAADEEAERRRKMRDAMDWLRQNALKGGVVVDWTREELYDREADRRQTPGCE